MSLKETKPYLFGPESRHERRVLPDLLARALHLPLGLVLQLLELVLRLAVLALLVRLARLGEGVKAEMKFNRVILVWDNKKLNQ